MKLIYSKVTPSKLLHLIHSLEDIESLSTDKGLARINVAPIEELLQLATSFNSFYRDCMILMDGELNVFNLQISEIARNLMRTSMEGLGIVPIEQM